MITLREDQLSVVNDTRTELADHQSVLVRAATGWGKTVFASYIVQQATARRRRVIFGVHRRELADQTASTFDKFGIQYGFIAAGRPSNPFAIAQIASADTLRNRPELLRDCALFIPDESHLWASRTREDLIRQAMDAGAKVVGLSATPERLDGKPLTIFETIVHGPSESWLIENGHLSDYRAFAPVRPDMSGLHTQAGDYVVGELEERFDKPSITGDAVSMWRRYAEGKRTIVFAISRQHGQHVRQAYDDAGIHAVYIDGNTPHNERRDRIRAFADRGGVLVNIGLCVEGFDLSASVGRDVPIEAVQLLNPTKSLPRARQMMGRALRKKPYPAIILDHVNMIMNSDGTVNHGLPDQDREWSLEGRRRIKDVPAFDVKLCSSCFASYRASKPCCPYCSSEATVKPRVIEEVAGDLAEIDKAALKAKKAVEVRAARDIDSLARLAVERGYSPGWISQRLVAIGGKRPGFGEVHRALANARQVVACEV